MVNDTWAGFSACSAGVKFLGSVVSKATVSPTFLYLS